MLFTIIHFKSCSVQALSEKVIRVTDETIMSEVKKGNVKLLAILFERYHVKMYNFFLRLTGEKQTSEDLTQDVFFRILKYRESFRHESKYSTWMYQIGRNAYIDHLRKHKKELPLEESWNEKLAVDSTQEALTSQEQEIGFLSKALDKLAPNQKEVLVLSRFQGMKYKDISKLHGCSISSVKVQVHRAIKNLRKSYLNYKGGVA
jgi:RNA polymerase sigma factor (sigma-70 family)